MYHDIILCQDGFVLVGLHVGAGQFAQDSMAPAVGSSTVAASIDLMRLLRVWLHQQA